MAKARKKRHKQEKTVEMVRWGILGTVGLILGAIFVYAVLYTFGLFDNRELFSTLPDRETQTDHIEVIEFFSYACSACQRLEDRLKQFEENLPDNVSFSRTHVAFSANIRRLAAMHVALDLSGALDQNHDRIFQAASRDINTFSTRDRIGDFLDGHGITKAQFDSLYQGARVQRLVDQITEQSVELRVLGTPSLFVANKYLIHPNDPPVMMQTLNRIIRDIRSGVLPLPEEEALTDEPLESIEVEANGTDEVEDASSEQLDSTPQQPPQESGAQINSSDETESAE